MLFGVLRHLKIKLGHKFISMDTEEETFDCGKLFLYCICFCLSLAMSFFYAGLSALSWYSAMEQSSLTDPL